MPEMPESVAIDASAPEVNLIAPEAPHAGVGAGPFAANLSGFDFGAMDMSGSLGGF